MTLIKGSVDHVLDTVPQKKQHIFEIGRSQSSVKLEHLVQLTDIGITELLLLC